MELPDQSKKDMRFEFYRNSCGKVIRSERPITKKNREMSVTSSFLKDGDLIIKYALCESWSNENKKIKKKNRKKFGAKSIRIDGEYYEMNLFYFANFSSEGNLVIEYCESEVKSKGKKYRPICFNPNEFVKYDYEVINKKNEIVIKNVKGFTIGLFY